MGQGADKLKNLSSSELVGFVRSICERPRKMKFSARLVRSEVKLRGRRAELRSSILNKIHSISRARVQIRFHIAVFGAFQIASSLVMTVVKIEEDSD